MGEAATHAYLLHDGSDILRSSWRRCSTEQQGQQEECKSGLLHSVYCKQQEGLISGPDAISVHSKIHPVPHMEMVGDS